MFLQDTSNQVLVDVDSKRRGDDQGDSGAAEQRVTALDFDDDPNEFLGWPLRPRSSPRPPSRERRPLLAANEALVELVQCGRPNAGGHPGYSPGRNEQGAERQHEALEGQEIRGPLSAPTENEQLLLHEQVLCHQSAHSTRSGQSGEHGDKVDHKDQESFHQDPE